MSENHVDYSGQNNPNFGKHCSDETKGKISKALTGLFCGEKNPMYGKVVSIETRQKLSKINSGQNHPMYGKSPSEQTRQKISESQVGEKNNKAKLSWNNVNEIRDLYEKGQFTCEQLANKFGVKYNCIWNVVTNKTWKIKEEK